MAYQVDRFNGTFLVSVADGTIDTTTDIRFVGKNYAGYGEVQNENFLHMLENFANTSAPPKAITGQIWYDSSNKKLRFYDGNKFKYASGAEVSDTAPTGLTQGDFWFDSAAQQLYCWSGTEFILIGPAAAPEFGASAAIGQVVQDREGNPKTIIKMVVGNDTVAIVSKETFTLNSSNSIPGFTEVNQIKKGITLINTDATTGITNVASDYTFWGTASNSLRLGGISADSYLTKGNLVFDEQVKFNNPGFVLGDDNDLRIFVETRDALGNDFLRDEDQLVVYQSEVGQPITVRIQTTEVESINLFKFRSTGLIPGATNAYSIGSSALKLASVYSTNFYGNVNGDLIADDLTILVDASEKTVNAILKATDLTTAFDPSSKTFFGTLGSPSDRSLVYGDLIGDVTGSSSSANSLGIYSPSIALAPESVAVRDSSGDLTARFFLGTATKADRLKIDNTATDSDPNYRSAKTTAAAQSIAARDSSGNLTAILFNGTATAARYADLAEKYLPDEEYEVGTVVAVGGEKEITAAGAGHRAIGVISANPAFMMNSELDGGVYVALKGRVPVRVIGSVKKGQKLIAADTGLARADDRNQADFFAISLESSDIEEVKLIEAIIL